MRHIADMIALIFLTSGCAVATGMTRGALEGCFWGGLGGPVGCAAGAPVGLVIGGVTGTAVGIANSARGHHGRGCSAGLPRTSIPAFSKGSIVWYKPRGALNLNGDVTDVEPFSKDSPNPA